MLQSSDEAKNILNIGNENKDYPEERNATDQTISALVSWS